MTKLFISVWIIFSLYIVFPNLNCTLAQENAPSAGDFTSWIDNTVPNFNDASIGDIISALMPFVYAAAGFAVLLFLVLGAYQIMISQGEPKQMAAGREKITYAIVGFVIMFAAYWITKILGEILDIEQIRNIFG